MRHLVVTAQQYEVCISVHQCASVCISVHANYSIREISISTHTSSCCAVIFSSYCIAHLSLINRMSVQIIRINWENLLYFSSRVLQPLNSFLDLTWYKALLFNVFSLVFKQPHNSQSASCVLLGWWWLEDQQRKLFVQFADR